MYDSIKTLGDGSICWMILASAQTSTWEALGQLLSSPYPPEYFTVEGPTMYLLLKFLCPFLGKIDLFYTFLGTTIPSKRSVQSILQEVRHWWKADRTGALLVTHTAIQDTKLWLWVLCCSDSWSHSTSQQLICFQTTAMMRQHNCRFGVYDIKLSSWYLYM